MLKTTAATERLIAQADYDYGNMPSGVLLDSIRLTYSSNRGSAFDFDNLTYDFINSTDAPSPYIQSGYVQFDTGREYGLFSSGYAIRTYNQNGKVVRSELPDAITFFTYNAQGKLIQKTQINYDQATKTLLDSNSSNLYTYDASVYRVKDRGLYRNASPGFLQPDLTTIYANNAAGYPMQITFKTFFGPTPFIFSQMNYSYNTANKPILIITKYDNGSGILVSDTKDTIGYTGNMRKLLKSYNWNDVTSAWEISYEEYRRLNAASLPDSVFSRDYFNTTWDTTIQKLAYNAQGNPLYLRSYTAGATTQDYDSRWYYETYNGVGVAGVAAKKDIVAYPNPATNMLYINGASAGRYFIHNTVGQVLQSGMLEPSSGVPVQALPPGSYTFSLQDKAGAMHVAQFIRQ